MLLARRRRCARVVRAALDHRLARGRRRLADLVGRAARGARARRRRRRRSSATTSSRCSRSGCGRASSGSATSATPPAPTSPPRPTRPCPTRSGCGRGRCGCSSTSSAHPPAAAPIRPATRSTTVVGDGWGSRGVRRRVRRGPGAPPRRQLLRGQPHPPPRPASPTSTPSAAYLRLRELNPAPYSGFLQHDVADARAWLLSSSPERYALDHPRPAPGDQADQGHHPARRDARRGRGAARRGWRATPRPAPRT